MIAGPSPSPIPASRRALTAPSVGDCLAELERLHPRLCPRQVLGVRIGLQAGGLLGLDLPRRDKRLLVLVEMDGCFADGVSVPTGCWLGRRTLRLLDDGKSAATFVDVKARVAVRIWPARDARQHARAYAPTAASRWQAQLLGYQRMPADELLRWKEVPLPFSLEGVVGSPGRRTTCSVCGEDVMNGRELLLGRGAVCRGCAIDQRAPTRTGEGAASVGGAESSAVRAIGSVSDETSVLPAGCSASTSTTVT